MMIDKKETLIKSNINSLVYPETIFNLTQLNPKSSTEPLILSDLIPKSNVPNR